jgi:UDP-sugar transporter A1/2/3
MGFLGLDAKALSLAVLTLQNTCLVLTMRISRTRTNVPMYLASVAVMTDEIMKLVVCIVMLLLAYRSVPGYNLVSDQRELRQNGFVAFFKSEVFQSSFDFFKMSVPAMCYAVQKNLLYVAISNLDAAVFQVAYQGKIVTTALFSVAILRKKLTMRQILGLCILLIGVAMVQLSTLDPSSTKQAIKKGNNPYIGMLSVLAACCTSGFAAIYFEWTLKMAPPQQQKPYSLWVRNFQLAFFAVIVAAFGVWSKDGEAVAKAGIYQGFTPLVWLVVSLEAFGGIVVALVIKYADNLLKNFATAVSIVTSVIVSSVFLEFQIRPMFVFGTVCVMAAVAIYTSNPKAPMLARPHDKDEVEMAQRGDPKALPTGRQRAGLESGKFEI